MSRDHSRCAAEGCEVPVPSNLLMCRAHWYRVPVPIRRAVLHHWRNGPARSYMHAREAAIEAVRKSEAPDADPS